MNNERHLRRLLSEWKIHCNKGRPLSCLWPGRTQSRVKDTDRSPLENAPPSYAKVSKYCSNQLTVKLKDIDRLLQSLAGCHHVMIAGTYEKALRDEMMRMGVNIIGPSDMSNPA